MNLSGSTDYSDIVNNSYVSGTQTVSTTQIEAKVGGSPLSHRQILIIHNPSFLGNTIYFGPTGVTTSTGVPIAGGETVFLPVGDCINIYLIKAAAGGSVSAIIQELS